MFVYNLKKEDAVMENRICPLINKAALYHKRLMAKMLERFEVTYAQYHVLKTIKEHQSLTAKEILVHLDTDKATLSGVLNRLEQKNLITRTKDENDRRLLHVHLTKAAGALLEAIRTKEKECEESISKGIKSRELKNFLNVMDKIIDNQLEKLDELSQED